MTTRNDTDRGAPYDASTQSPPPEPASVPEDFIDVFHAPSAVYARRANKGYGIHLLVISVAAALFAFAGRGVMAQIMDAEFSRRAGAMLASNPQLTPEIIEAQRGLQTNVGLFFAYVGTPVIIFVMAFFVWMLARLFSARVTYGQAAMITTIAWIPRLVGMLVTTAQIALMDTTNMTNMFSLTLSPARFLDPDTTNPQLFGLAGTFELFSIWSTILIGIGIAVVAKVPRARGYAVAAILFALGTIPLLFR